MKGTEGVSGFTEKGHKVRMRTRIPKEGRRPGLLVLVLGLLLAAASLQAPGEAWALNETVVYYFQNTAFVNGQ